MKVIITGSSGMVGKATLIECLESKHVEKVLVVNRSSINMEHSKLTEILHADFNDFTNIQEELKGYDACFHCMGVSSIGMSEDQFSKLTYDITASLADLLYELNPNMVFNYVSGMGTDSTEKGSAMWARVKGKTENKVLSMGFKDVYAFRLGMLLPEKGVKSRTSWYNILYVITRPFYPIFKKMKSVTPSSSFGLAMINTVLYPQELKHLENKDINKLALRGL